MAEIRRYLPGDETTLSILLRRTLLEVNALSCPKEEIDWLYDRYTPETVAQNRRVEVYILPSKEMIEAANAQSK